MTRYRAVDLFSGLKLFIHSVGSKTNSIGELLGFIEIEHLLTETNVPLKSIIKMYSFTNHGHFALFCRKYLKKTPLKIRKEARANKENLS